MNRGTAEVFLEKLLIWINARQEVYIHDESEVADMYEELILILTGNSDYG